MGQLAEGDEGGGLGAAWVDRGQLREGGSPGLDFYLPTCSLDAYGNPHDDCISLPAAGTKNETRTLPYP
ncbi:hypothetical protein ACLKA6_004279 [Drosophila palustris]